jgi:hypothetical protein
MGHWIGSRGLRGASNLVKEELQMGIHALPARRWGRISLVALLGLTLALVTVTAGRANAGEAGHAVVAKKKCKKKKHRSASSAKKKKCKKKMHRVVLPAPAPLVRGTLSWSSASSEIDLHAFDASGNHAGWDYTVNPPGGSLVNNIPNARHNGDVGPAGPSETFTDDIFVPGGPSTREFGYVACIYGPDAATFTGVTSSGQSSSVSLSGPDAISLTTSGGAPIPFNPC